MPKRLPWLLSVILGLSLLACQPAAPPEREVFDEGTDSVDGGAISTAPVRHEPALPRKQSAPGVDWLPLVLSSGKAWASCELNYQTESGDQELHSLERQALTEALAPCDEGKVMRLRYQGKIAGDFAALIERIVVIADEQGIGKRVLDIDSAGGTVEDAIRAGDSIASAHWSIWVREDSVCHSACVFVLGAGDSRTIAGRVGIHRLIRLSSTATTRAELNSELRTVYAQVKDYLERNGVAVVLADQMMSVPNRSLRLLTDEELKTYGLDGINAAQDDLDRLRLMRKCGEDFVRRRDQFARQFDAQCKSQERDIDALNACGLQLRKKFGFPDEACLAESPMSEFDTLAEMLPMPGYPAGSAGMVHDASRESHRLAGRWPAP
ncbi:MAG: hypothetical protein LBL59_06185 [Xanthomonadaceae bacterium]|jgi:hypothetical protein|nr:hypothetical protein [Xanthomonadaceae bacterium]